MEQAKKKSDKAIAYSGAMVLETTTDEYGDTITTYTAAAD
jgi:hypothetical protein